MEALSPMWLTAKGATDKWVMVTMGYELKMVICNASFERCKDIIFIFLDNGDPVNM